MDKNVKRYFLILGISLMVLLLEVFVLKFKGALGLILCIASIYFIVGIMIRLLKVSELFNTDIFEKIDILFFLK